MVHAGWAAEADLVVVGFGAAGAATAITAADAGAEVLILEKQPRAWHTPSTRASGGQVMSVTDVEAATTYLDRCAGGMVPVEVSRAWANRAIDVLDWLGDVAGLSMVRVAPAEHPDWEGSWAVAGYGALAAYPEGEGTWSKLRDQARIPGGGGVLFGALERAVTRRRQASVEYETAATNLITDDEKRVIGVEAKGPSGPVRVRARRGVVLTCGGYEFDEDLKRSCLRSHPTHFYGSPMNTGDGVRMAQALGADLWHMNCMAGRGVAHFELNAKPYNFAVRVAPGGYVFLDKHGKRFANEHLQAMSRHDFYYELVVYDSARAEYPRMPCHWVFDSRRMSAGPPVAGSGAAGPHHYEWSENSADEIKRGWVRKADTLGDLIELTGITNVTQAVKTLDEYNHGCASGVDRFGRTGESLIPLDAPPFYSMELWPGGPNTCGGPRRNERAQVIDVFGDPIRGLHEAGELGEAVGALYPSNGANISDALCFGRIAAEHALQSTGLE